MMKGCSIKFTEKEIIVTKKFLKAAETYGTEEFETLLRLSKEMPDFTIRQNENRKYSYNRVA